MAKPIPKAKGKKKRQEEIGELFDPKSQRKAEREISHFVMELDESSEVREEYVRRILKVNDDSVEKILDEMVASLRTMEGPPKIVYKGHTYNAVKGETELLEKIQTRNFRWIGMRVLVACAEWDIRIGKFQLPTDLCARCGVKIKKGRKK